MRIIRKPDPIPPAPKPDWPRIVQVIKSYKKYSWHRQEGFDHDYDVRLRKNWYSWANFHIGSNGYIDDPYVLKEYVITCQEKDLLCVIEFANYVEQETKSKVTIIFDDKSLWWKIR
jgi:hypothetical protein